MGNIVKSIVKNAVKDPTYREELTPFWMVGSVVVGVVVAITITSAVSKGFSVDQDLME